MNRFAAFAGLMVALPLLFWGVLIILVVAAWLLWDRRRYGRRETTHIPPGFVRTEEVAVDPVSGRRERVYYNPLSGERIYIEESS